MQLQRIKYSDLNARQKEVYNFQKVAALLADYGFNCLKPSEDWQGADFLAYHKDGRKTLRVQLKSRLHIAKKYSGRDLHMCFPVHKTWYLVPHDDLVRALGRRTTFLQSESWLGGGAYSSVKPNQKMLEWLKRFAF